MLKRGFNCDLANILAYDVDGKEEILGANLCLGDLVMLYAGTGVGKTFVSVKLAHSLITCGQFIKWKVPRRYKVAYFDGEMGHDQLHRRFTAIENSSKESVTSGWLQLYPYDMFESESIPDLANPMDQAKYDQLSKDAEVIIIDNLLTCTKPQGRNDSEVEQWGRVQDWLIKKRAEKKTVILVHHSGKSGDQLGSSVKKNILDTVIALNKSSVQKYEDSTAIELEWNKARNFGGVDGEPLHIEVVTEDGRDRWIESTLYDVIKDKYFDLKYSWGETAAREFLGLKKWQAVKFEKEANQLLPTPEEEDDDRF